jgi:hypothetical protein
MPLNPEHNSKFSIDPLSKSEFLSFIIGLINVRTDGNALFAARRVAEGYQFVAYEPIALAVRTPDS